MAQLQDLKRKGGADPDHQMSKTQAPPPPLSIEVPKMSDLPDKSKPWSDVQLPVDILLSTVEDCEFLGCYAFLENSFKSYHQNLGFVYFGTMGESGEEALKVALMKCYKGSSGPGGSQIVIKNAVMQLRPKAALLVGSCQGIKPEHTKLGDVVVSSKLSTEQFTTPVRRNIGNLILFSAGGWNPPLKDPVDEKTVQVHRDSDIFSGSQFITKQRRMSQSQVIAIEREGEGKIMSIFTIIITLQYLILPIMFDYGNGDSVIRLLWGVVIIILLLCQEHKLLLSIKDCKLQSLHCREKF